MTEDKFTAREVGVLIEELRSDFRTVSEGLTSLLPLKEDMIEVKNRLSNLEFEVRTLKDVIRVEIPSIKSRLSAVEAKVN